SRRTTGTGSRSPETGKLSTALVVSPPHNCSVKAFLRWKFSRSLQRIDRQAPEASAAGAAGVESFAVGGEEPGWRGLLAGHVAGGDDEPADEVGMDPFALFGSALDRAEQVTELEVRGAAGLGPRLGVERGRRLDQRFPDPGEVTAGLVAGEAFADQRVAFQQHFVGRGREGPLGGVGAFAAGNRGRVVRAAATD